MKWVLLYVVSLKVAVSENLSTVLSADLLYQKPEGEKSEWIHLGLSGEGVSVLGMKVCHCFGMKRNY